MKSSRHALIMDIIKSEVIETQDQLAERLQSRGVAVTQATISRDIKELRLNKVVNADGAYKYDVVENSEVMLLKRFLYIFNESLISMAASGNIIVIRTLSGSANAAAEAIDSLKWNEILGTIAGDNTVFVAVRENVNTSEIINKLYDLMN